MTREELKIWLVENQPKTSQAIKKMSPDVYAALCNITLASNKVSPINAMKIILNDLEGYCQKCGGITRFNGQTFTLFCSHSCSNSDPNRTRLRGKDNHLSDPMFREKLKTIMLDKYGVEHVGQSAEIRQKSMATNKARYGTTVACNSPQMQADIRERSLEKHGVDWHTKRQDVIAKRQQTCMSQYGHTNYLASNVGKKHIVESCIAKYGVENIGRLNATPIDVDLLRGLYLTEKLSTHEIADKLGVSQTLVVNELARNGIDSRKSSQQSSHERWLSLELTNLNVEHSLNDRTILAHINKRKSKELDVVIPRANLAIEINGLYFHRSSSVGKNYHTNKLKMCNERGWKLIQFTDVDLKNKPDLCLSMIKARIGLNDKLFARNTEICELPVDRYKSFCIANHIGGYSQSSIRLGLIHAGEIVMVMGISRSRYDSSDWEITRMAASQGTTVVGGASKLFKHFIKTHNPRTVTSYADRRYGEGRVYSELGFDFSHTTPPNYWYFNAKDYRLQSRVKFQKHKLSKLLINFDSSKTERENMEAAGYYQFHDCGSNKYVFS